MVLTDSALYLAIERIDEVLHHGKTCRFLNRFGGRADMWPI
jgi:hypothetical protein